MKKNLQDVSKRGNLFTMNTTKDYSDLNNLCPYDWRNWDNVNWTIACGGNEIPSYINGKWYLLVLNLKEQKYYYYCFNEDIFKTEKEFEDILNVSINSSLSYAKKINSKKI